MRVCGCCLLTVALAACTATQPSHFTVRPWQGRDRAETFRQAPPPAGPAVTLPPQAVVEARLRNGLRLLLVPRDDFPMVHLAVLVRRGTADAAPGVVDMLVRVAQSKAQGWQVKAAPDALWVFAAMPAAEVASRFPSAVALLRQPDLAEDGFAALQARVREEANAATPIDASELVSVASGLIYPASHRYHEPTRGQAAAMSEVNRHQIDNFVDQHVAPDQMVVVAVGAITMAQLTQLAQAQLGNWTHAAVPREPPPPPVEGLPSTPAITLIDQATLTQSEILVAAPGSSALADDFAALEVLNAVLCGASTTGSRLNSVLREELGYTYFALSTIVPRLGPGPFLLRQAVAKESTAAALREIIHQIDRLRREDVPADELAVAKARLQSSVLLTYDSFPETLRTLIKLAMLGLPAQHTALQLARLDRVSARDVRLAAAKYLAAERLRVVVAGDVAAIRKPLQASGLGRVQVLER